VVVHLTDEPRAEPCKTAQVFPGHDAGLPRAEAQ
jgi:hypothetical protein